jgi:hypothetical protein
MVGDSVVVLLNALVPGNIVKFLPEEVAIVTVPAGKVGFTSGKLWREPVNGPLILPPSVVEVTLMELTRTGVIGIILGNIGAGLGFTMPPIRTIGGRARAGATIPNKLKQAKTKTPVRLRIVRMTPLL